MISTQVKLPYRIYIPESYTSEKKYKVLIFMHGAGERGSDNNHLCKEDYHRYLRYVLDDPILRNEFILFAPQCEKSCTWVTLTANTDTLEIKSFPKTECSDALALVYDFIENKLTSNYNIDGRRIYMTGLSMGAFATWYTLIHKPNLLAAAVPICGGGDPKDIHKAKNTPIWAFHSLDDDVVPAECLTIAEEIMKQENAKDFHATMYENEGHGSFIRAYKDKDVFNWMISKINQTPQIM